MELLTKLIDREKEKQQFLDAQQSGIRINFLIGAGGIGKTRLLQELPKLLDGYTDYWLDFDNYRKFSLPYRLELELADQIGGKTKQIIQNNINQLELMERRGDSEASQVDQRKKIYHLLSQEMANAIQGRVLLLCDTAEKIDRVNQKVFYALTEIVSHLPNAFCVFAGRDTDENGQKVKVWYKLRNRFREVNQIDLEPFDQEASAEYLSWKEKEAHTLLEPNERKMLLEMCRGKPILLDLAVEFITRNIDLTQILTFDEESLSQLDMGEKKAAYQKFEINLVRYLRKFSNPLDRIVTVLAHVYPLGNKEIEKLLGLSEQAAVELFQIAKKLVFVKKLPPDEDNESLITLHDEMRRMIIDYVWDEIDPEEAERKEYSRIAEIIYRDKDQQYKREKDEKQKQLRELPKKDPAHEVLKREVEDLRRKREYVTEIWVYHAVFAHAESVFDELVELITKIRRARKFTFAGRIIKQIEIFKEKLSQEKQLEFEFLLARQYMDVKKFEEARVLFEGLLGTYHERESNIFNLLGVIETNLGNLEEARDYEEKSLKLLWGEHDYDEVEELTDDELQAIMFTENWTGYVNRLLEDVDRENLNHAIIHYDRSIKSALEYVRRLNQKDNKEEIKQSLESTRSLIASVLNNQGYVLGLQGKYKQAEMRCEKAIEIWEQIGQTRKIAFAEIALGILERDQNQYQNAIQLLRRAIKRLQLPDDAEYFCRALFHLGWTYWFDAEESRIANKPKLELAAESLREAKAYAEEFEVKREIPGTLHQLASVLWRLGRLEQNDALCAEARQLNEQAIEQSVELENWRYWVDSIVGKAEFDWNERKGENLQDYFDQLSQYDTNYIHFPLYYGRMLKILGDYALYQERDDDAISRYGEGYKLISQHGGYGPYSIERELKQFSDKLAEMSEVRRNYLLHGLEKEWNSVTESKVDLLDWCNQQIIHYQLFGSKSE